MWFEESVFYQIYPLGLCGAPRENDGGTEPRILKLLDWVPHIKKLGADTVLFNPVFDSDRHGYDTRDYFRVDPRLGTNGDLAAVCRAFHDAGIRVVLDGVFNHVGRGFWAFRDVQEKKWDSPYKDWFHIDFGGNTNYNDGFWYEGWEGHYELVKLNLQNPAVVDYLFEAHPLLGGAVRHRRAAAGRGLLPGPGLPDAGCAPSPTSLKPDFVLRGGDAPRGLQPLDERRACCHSVHQLRVLQGAVVQPSTP